MHSPRAQVFELDGTISCGCGGGPGQFKEPEGNVTVVGGEVVATYIYIYCMRDKRKSNYLGPLWIVPGKETTNILQRSLRNPLFSSTALSSSINFRFEKNPGKKRNIYCTVCDALGNFVQQVFELDGTSVWQ